MKKIFSLFAAILFVGSMMAADVTGTINFGSASGSTAINATSVTGDDSQGNEWTIATTFGGETSFTQNASYSQVGAAKKPASSITFTTTLPAEQTIKAFSAKFGGFNSTEGAVTLKVGETTVGSGSLNGTNDVIVSATNTTTSGTVLTVTVTDIAKGVKVYYISYTYALSEDVVANPTISGETPFLHTTTVTLECITEDAAIRYTTDGTDPTSTSTLYENPFELSATTTVKAKAFKGEKVSEIATKEFVKATIWTVAEANAALDESSPLSGRYVHGIISQIDSYNSGAITYWISDDGTTSDQLEVYKGKGQDGAAFSSIDDLQVGDIVTVFGTLKIYNTTKEFDSNSKIVEFERPAVDLPKVEIWGDWDDFTKHELTPALNNLTASYTVELTEVKDYQFAFIYNESSYYLPTVKITRADNEAECDGTTGNATIEADATGEYTFTWTYATNTVTVTYPDLPLPTYTVTFDLGISKDQPTLTEEEGGAGITLPAGPVPTCAEWAFAGWAEAKVASETTAAPDELFKAGTTYHPADNVILYAVYKRVEGADFDGTEGGDFYIYANVGGTNYYAKDFAQKLESTTDINEAVMFTFEKVVEDEVTYFAIKSGDVYLKYGSSTNFGTQADPYKWQPTAGEHGSWRLKASTTLEASTVRSIVYRAGDTNKFAPYGISNINGTEYFDVEIAGGTTYYHSTPSCWATSVDNTDATNKAVKFIQNGQLFIEMNGRIYNVQGQTVK